MSGHPELTQHDSDMLVRNFLNRATGANDGTTRAYIREMLYISICAAGARLDHGDLIRDFLIAMGADPYGAVVAADVDQEVAMPAPRTPAEVESALVSAMQVRSDDDLMRDEQIEQDVGDLFGHLRRHFEIDTSRGIAHLLVSCVTDEIDENEDVGRGIAAGLPRDLAIISSVEASGYAGDQYRPHEEGLTSRR